MISILIPIGDVPFFPEALIKNIKETIGISNYKIHFLISNPSNRILEELSSISEEFYVHIKNLSSFTKGIHLNLLDWAMYNLPLSEWVYVQHADMFWKTNNWFYIFQKYMKNFVAIMPPYNNSCFNYKHYKFKFKGENVIRCHDFSGMYHKPSFVENNLNFFWSRVKNCGKKVILQNLQNFELIQELRVLNENDFLDGSDLISLYYRYLGKNVCEIKENIDYYHCWGLFGLAWNMNKENNAVYINETFKNSLIGMKSYSWISSFCFNYDIWEDRVFPWFITKQITYCKKDNFSIFVEKYKSKNHNCLGFNSNGIKKVCFKDVDFLINNILL